MNPGEMKIFEPTLQRLGALSMSHRVGMVVRHSVRFPILSQEDVYTVGLTPEGVRLAEEFGGELAQIRRPGRLISSPVGRCLHTAEAISRGAGWGLNPQPDYRLSHPFIEPAWNALPIRWREDPLPEQLSELVNLLLEGEDQPGVLDIFTTHDTIIAVLAEFFTGLHFHYPGYWPDFLEGVLIWRNGGEVHLRWRDEETVIGAWPVSQDQQLEFKF